MELNAGQPSPDTQQALADIRSAVEAQRFAVLATQAEGQPYASLVAFAVTGDLRRVIFCTPRATRKYANLSRDGRVAVLVHTGRNAMGDCAGAMAVTATGTAGEVPDNRKEQYSAALRGRHPELADFIGDPRNVLLAIDVSEFHLVRRFQDVVRIRLEPMAGAPAGAGAAEPAAPRTAVVLLAHGSRDSAWREWFEHMAASLAASLGQGRVRPAYLQFSCPTLLESVTAAAEEGFRRIAVLPIFISAGGHVMRDVPSQVSAVRERWPDLVVTVLPRIGEGREFSELIERSVREALGSLEAQRGRISSRQRHPEASPPSDHPAGPP